MVEELAGKLGLQIKRTANNDWAVSGPEGHRGMLSYNQKSGVWKAIGGSLSKAHYGEVGGLLNLFACTKAK
jgi:hypothetical protein